MERRDIGLIGIICDCRHAILEINHDVLHPRFGEQGFFDRLHAMPAGHALDADALGDEHLVAPITINFENFLQHKTTRIKSGTNR